MSIYNQPVTLKTAAKYHCSPQWVWQGRQLYPDCLNIWYVTRGRGTISTANSQFKIAPGHCLLIRGWHPVSASHDPDNPLTVYWNYFKFNNLQLPAPESHLPPLHRCINNQLLFTQLYDQLVNAFNASPSNLNEPQIWLQALLLALKNEDSGPHLTGLQKEQSDTINQICALITSQPEYPFTITQLAAKAGFSTSHFYRIFKSYKKISPKDFITQTRLNTAKSLLQTSTLSIKQIALELGFKDIFYFSSQFKKLTGTSPSKFRASQSPPKS